MKECSENIVAKHNWVQLGKDKYREPINDDKDIIKKFTEINIVSD